MSKIITSPVKEFPGTVTLSDPLTFPQAIAFENSRYAVRELERKTMLTINYAMVPGILACVEKWDIRGLENPPQAETFPSTPGNPVAELLAWLIAELTKLFLVSEGGDPLA